jgi:hypothetical protein
MWLSFDHEHNRALPLEALEREFLAASENLGAWELGGWLPELPGDSEAEFQESEDVLNF